VCFLGDKEGLFVFLGFLVSDLLQFFYNFLLADAFIDVFLVVKWLLFCANFDYLNSNLGLVIFNLFLE
jgi:hypothetical protein